MVPVGAFEKLEPPRREAGVLMKANPLCFPTSVKSLTKIKL